MKRFVAIFTPAAVWISSSSALHAAQGEHSAFDSLLNIAFTFAPIILLCAVLFLMPRFTRKWTDPYIKRYEEHFERLETQLKRIADALEKRDK